MSIYQEPNDHREEPPYHWLEIEDALNGLHAMAELDATPPEDLAASQCPQCGHAMPALRWANADECWQGLCGVAGWIRYCRPCQTWTGLLGDDRLIN